MARKVILKRKITDGIEEIYPKTVIDQVDKLSNALALCDYDFNFTHSVVTNGVCIVGSTANDTTKRYYHFIESATAVSITGAITANVEQYFLLHNTGAIAITFTIANSTGSRDTVVGTTAIEVEAGQAVEVSILKFALDSNFLWIITASAGLDVA